MEDGIASTGEKESERKEQGSDLTKKSESLQGPGKERRGPSKRREMEEGGRVGSGTATPIGPKLEKGKGRRGHLRLRN